MASTASSPSRPGVLELCIRRVGVELPQLFDLLLDDQVLLRTRWRCHVRLSFGLIADLVPEHEPHVVDRAHVVRAGQVAAKQRRVAPVKTPGRSLVPGGSTRVALGSARAQSADGVREGGPASRKAPSWVSVRTQTGS